jgi:diguanylate cyclase (GGDEF)-like protein/PAS domain S-box-containing protein
MPLAYGLKVQSTLRFDALGVNSKIMDFVDVPLTQLPFVFEFISESFVITDAQLSGGGPNILYVNAAFEKQTGYQLREVIGRNPRFLQGAQTDRQAVAMLKKHLLAGESIVTELLNYTKDGQPFWVELNIHALRDHAGQVLYYISIQKDVTARKTKQDDLHFKAHFDSLTRVANRNQFFERLEQVFSEAQRASESFCVAMLDLDRFKPINDQFGHHAGDVVLQKTASRVNGLLRDTDLVGRLGGDEFGIILTNSGGEAEATKIMGRILKALQKPIQVADQQHHVTASIGLAFYPSDASDAKTLLHHADLALYEVKRQGRNNVGLFQRKISSDVADRAIMEHNLRKAIREGQLELHYQPIHEVQNNALIGFEALVRWKNENHDYVPPDVFVPLAEERGMIDMLDAWVLWQACHQAALIHQKHPGWTISVNVAPTHFYKPTFVDEVKRALMQSGLPATALWLEITERTTIENPEISKQQLLELQELGIKVSIDDFGMGYSNLAQLIKLPLNIIKIDRFLIRDLSTNPRVRSVLQGLVELAHRLDCRIIAEGVETELERQLVVGLGCDFLQGYVLAPPMSSAELASYMARFSH